MRIGQRRKWVATAIQACLMVTGCINQNLVTMRPEYAYPQNLKSLCDSESVLRLVNKGHFATADFTDKSQGLLLSPQLLPFPPEVHRHITKVILTVSADAGVSTEAIDAENRSLAYQVPEDDLRCAESGELVITLPSDSFYFWASFGNKTRQLALWTNANADLIIQNRWQETQKGLIGGKIAGDAWALFKHDDSTYRHEVSLQQIEEFVNEQSLVEKCESLSGQFDTVGEVITPDGRIHSRTASAHFFREEITGPNPVNQHSKPASILELIQDDNNRVTMNLYGDDRLLATRVLTANEISCVEGKWVYKGEKKAHSAWMLVAASGGVYWEDLTLWRDHNGDLLVSGTYKSRGALLLVPFGQTEHTFVAFNAR